MTDEVRLWLALFMFAGATLSDLRTRRVRDPYWLPFLVVAGLFWLQDILTGRPDLLAMAVLAAGMCALLYGAWWMHTFGGADAKGLMVFAWLLPATPDLVASRTVPALDALVNASVMMLLLPVAFLAWNLLHGRLPGLVALLGVPMDIEDARARHVWPMHQIHQGRVTWRYWVRPSDDLEGLYQELKEHGLTTVWVTPKVPFMLLLTLGIGLWWAVGNVVLRAMATWLSSQHL